MIFFVGASFFYLRVSVSGNNENRSTTFQIDLLRLGLSTAHKFAQFRFGILKFPFS